MKKIMFIIFLSILITFILMLACVFALVGCLPRIYEDDNFVYSISRGYAKVKSVKNKDAMELVIPANVNYNNRTYNVEYIDGRAFASCNSLNSLTIGDNVKKIGYDAFAECTRLVEVYNKSSLYIVKGSFDYGLVGYYAKDVYTTEYQSKIRITDDGYVLYIDGSEKSLIQYIGSETNLTLPWGITEINNYAFKYCSSLDAVTIPDTVTSIGKRAFIYCESLSNINIPDSVTSIGYDAFYGCTSLVSITIPGSVVSVGDSAFDHCTNLTIYCEAESKPTDWNNYWTNQNRPVMWGSVLIDGYIYKIKDGNAIFGGVTDKDITTFEIPSTIKYLNNQYSVTGIGDKAFYKCTFLISVTVPDGVTSIGDDAFYYCKSLSNINIPDSVKEIGRYAFNGCRSLVSITIPDGVRSIRDNTFDYCESLLSITIPDSVKNIGRSAFENCTSLVNITIPDSVDWIGRCAFWGCTSLESINIPDGVYSIGEYTFCNCSALVSVTLGQRVSKIGDSAFSNCQSLSKLNIPDYLRSIGNHAFYNCNSLTSIIFPDSLTTIDYKAFENCTQLKSIIIPKSVTIIKHDAFNGCNKLTIYCEAESQPEWWDSDWNRYSDKNLTRIKVVWGYKDEN